MVSILSNLQAEKDAAASLLTFIFEVYFFFPHIIIYLWQPINYITPNFWDASFAKRQPNSADKSSEQEDEVRV